LYYRNKMKIYELFEQTVAPTPPGQGGKLPTTQPTEAPPNTSNTPVTPNPTGAPPSTTAGQTVTTPNTQQTAQQSMAAQQQMKQVTDQSKQTMTDLDKIAAQIVGLKQKQQQMQQQLQQPPAV
jgi:hypothetical protein